MIVGLTGGIAAGKSTVAALWRRWGAIVIDADRIGHALLAKGRPAWREVVERFGPGILDGRGRIDRRLLGAAVFADPKARADLNRITHPRIRARIEERIRRARAAGRLIVVDAPLLLEAGLEDLVDRVVVVTAPEEVQVERLVAGRGLRPEEARARLQAQWPQAEKVRRADYVIENSGTREELEARAAEVWEELRREEEAGLDRS
ncbi:MAG: dephospho-CoA kinase [Bacillota bacterium]|nr:dephospho-CoA kinase [Bacillota bacterium]